MEMVLQTLLKAGILNNKNFNHLIKEGLRKLTIKIQIPYPI